MKKYYSSLFLILLLSADISAQNFQWAKRAGLYAFDLGYGVGADNAGNVYIAGKYEMNAYFGGTYVGCAGNHDMYIAKYSPNGTFQWVKTAGGTGGDYALAVAVDGAGNSYVTGEIESTAKFGSVSISSNGDNDIFIAKYSTTGSLLWVKKLGGGTKSDKGFGISISGSSIYITGKFEGTGNFAGTTLSAAGGKEIFIAKYSTAGVFQWVKKAGGTGNDEGYAVSSDISGNAYVTGYFSGTASFSGTSITSKGGTDVFIAKYNSAGTLLWVKKTGGTANDAGNAIKVDNSGRVFVTGGFRYSSVFGATTLNAQGGNSDIFIARYDSNGNALWAKKAGGSDNDSGRGIAVDANSNTFITGNCGQTAKFGSTTLYGSDPTELYFASYDVAGNFRWVLKAGGPTDASDPDRFIEMGLSICTDPAGNVFASGAYRSSTSFGGTTLAPFSTHTEVYVTRINQGRSTDDTPVNAEITPSGEVAFCPGKEITFNATVDSSYQYQWLKDSKMIPGETKSFLKVKNPGIYSVLIIRGTDSITSQQGIVKETSQLVATINSSSSEECSDSNAVLRANAGEGFIYQWKRNGVDIPGATEDIYMPDEGGDYQVRIVQGSCFDWSAIKSIKGILCEESSDSLADVPLKQQSQQSVVQNDSLMIRIFPNPNKGIFTIQLNMPESTDAVLVELVNLVGQVLYSKQISSNKGYIHDQIELDSSIATGVYFLQVTSGNKVEKTRMMLCR
ncbi:MAG: SBBP repeat-containing protein [Bacteroidota bacterium]|nr:SBBP repeat-containing protein [Bacteroidota bacterium]